jgi:hypothetical protein
MRPILPVVLSAAAVITVSSAVLASETRVVTANRPSTIGFYFTYSSETCYSGAKPKFTVTSGPAHGSVTSAWRGVRVGTDAGRCAGKSVHGTQVIYKPAPGYRGTDRVSFIFSESEGNDYFVRPKEYTINITVR